MKLPRLLFAISLAAALVAVSALRVAEAQPVATGDDEAYRGYLAVRVLRGGELEVVDASRFPGRPHPIGRGFADLSYEYGTPTASLAVDEATVTVRVSPGAVVGGPDRVRAPVGVDVLNHTATVGRERGGAGPLDFIPVWGTDTLLLRGEYPVNEPPFVVSASDPAPELRAASRLRDTLGKVGVTIAGDVRFRRRAASVVERDQVTVLAEFQSVPFRSLLNWVLTRSHNWFADMLTLTLAREVTGSGRFDDGVDVISDFVRGLRANADGGATAVDRGGIGSLDVKPDDPHHPRAGARPRTRASLGPDADQCARRAW
jgi:D-alanyl-D-alanine carboxypeptidase